MRVLENDLTFIYVLQGPGDKTSQSKVMNNIFDLTLLNEMNKKNKIISRQETEGSWGEKYIEQAEENNA